MRFIHAIWAAAAIALAPGLSGCDALGFGSWTWHQRLVLEVDTPHGFVSGGSVIAVRAGRGPKWLPGEGRGGMGTSARGEASFVEVAPGKYLFAVLHGNREAELALVLFFPEPAPDTFERARRLEDMRGIREVPRERFPRLVTFDDINDPATAREVDPADLAATFGSGVALRGITLELTGEAVTRGRIDRLMPWLSKYYNKMLDEGEYETIRAENRVANSLSASNFDAEK